MLNAVTEQIAIRLDDRLAESARAAAAASGTNLSAWVRSAIRNQVALSVALRARTEEDARGQLYSESEEDALMDARARRALAAFAFADADTDASFDGPAAERGLPGART